MPKPWPKSATLSGLLRNRLVNQTDRQSTEANSLALEAVDLSVLLATTNAYRPWSTWDLMRQDVIPTPHFFASNTHQHDEMCDLVFLFLFADGSVKKHWQLLPFEKRFVLSQQILNSLKVYGRLILFFAFQEFQNIELSCIKMSRFLLFVSVQRTYLYRNRQTLLLYFQIL